MGRRKERTGGTEAGGRRTGRGLVSMRSAVVLAIAAVLAAVPGLAAGVVAAAAMHAIPDHAWAPAAVGAAAGITAFFRFAAWLDSLIESAD